MWSLAKGAQDPHTRRTYPPREPNHVSIEVDDDSETRGTPKGPRRVVGGEINRRINREESDQEVQGIKFTIPTFNGTSDPNEFLGVEWSLSTLVMLTPNIRSFEWP